MSVSAHTCTLYAACLLAYLPPVYDWGIRISKVTQPCPLRKLKKKSKFAQGVRSGRSFAALPFWARLECISACCFRFAVVRADDMTARF